MAPSKIIATVLLVMAMAAAASAATYTVGDSAGWIIPDTSNFYDRWAVSKTFRVNDKLVFNFPTGAHTAVRVSEADYKACNFANPIETYSTGPATITLKDAGAHYYLCSIPGHCAAGQKVSINVVSAPSSPPPSKAPSAPSPSPVARPPSPVSTPPASSPPPSTASPAPSSSPVVRPRTPFVTPPSSSPRSPPPSMASPAPSRVVRPPTPSATPPAPFSVPPASSPSPSFPPSSLASPLSPGSPSPSAGTPPASAGAPGTSSTPSNQPTSSAASFTRGFKWTASTIVALVVAFTIVW